MDGITEAPKSCHEACHLTGDSVATDAVPLISALCREVQVGINPPLRWLLGGGDAQAGIGQVRGKDTRGGGKSMPGMCLGTSKPGCRHMTDLQRGGW